MDISRVLPIVPMMRAQKYEESEQRKRQEKNRSRDKEKEKDISKKDQEYVKYSH